jgi:isopentenyl-diphosphate Delta-isomerase
MMILVDEDDNPIGQSSKIEAHKQTLLHRAFSVFIINSEGKILMQQRAKDKYYSGGLWANTCCNHPFPGEDIYEAAYRRLWEETGIKAELKYLMKLQYYAPFDNGLSEYEIDSFFIGYSNKKPLINREEVQTYKYMDFQNIEEDISENPENYSVWFKIIFERLLYELDNEQLEIPVGHFKF